jgi:hypothetical protein
VGKTEELIKRKIRYVIFNASEFAGYRKTLTDGEMLLIWES